MSKLVLGLLGCDGKDGVEQVLVDIICSFLYFSVIPGAHSHELGLQTTKTMVEDLPQHHLLCPDVLESFREDNDPFLPEKAGPNCPKI